MFDEVNEGWERSDRTPENDLRTRLRADHVNVCGLIDALLASEPDDVEMREALAAEIVVELIAHARAEEEVVYVWLQQGSTTRNDTLRSIRDHDELDLLVRELKFTDGEDPGLEDLVLELKEAVRRHVWDEEHSLLPLAEREFGHRQLARLVPLFNARKAELVADLDDESPARTLQGGQDQGSFLSESDSRH